MRIDEQLKLERERLEKKKKIDMSKNLINILFKRELEQKPPRPGKEQREGSANQSKNLEAQKSAGLSSANNPSLNKAAESQDSGDGNLDQDAYQYFITTFQNHGFDFYIEFSELKFDYKADFIGGGGYGEVFKAQWIGNTVAVKRFGRKCVSKKSIIDFIKEIEIVNQMRHPNIIFYMGVTFDEENHYYMVTEYSSNGSIFDLLHSQSSQAGRRLPHSKNKVLLEDGLIFKIIKEMALATHYLHTKKILHCDLKSQNILLSEDWTVKICDFGLARYKEKFKRDNHGKVGTPHWMAPEILRGEQYTEAADVYSFGVILWELVTGEIPHRGRSVPQIVGSVGFHGQKLKLPKPHQDQSSSHSPGSNPYFRKIISRCTQHDSSLRPSFMSILSYIDQVE
jgi:tRNA A-37 threonylcarbamoyl transferase component Bud32